MSVTPGSGWVLAMLRTVPNTWHPCLVNFSAAARPMPDDTPVITTTVDFDMDNPCDLGEKSGGANQCDDTACRLRCAAASVRGLILNQMEYIAGRNTSVSTVPAKVPPISV